LERSLPVARARLRMTSRMWRLAYVVTTQKLLAPGNCLQSVYPGARDREAAQKPLQLVQKHARNWKGFSCDEFMQHAAAWQSRRLGLARKFAARFHRERIYEEHARFPDGIFPATSSQKQQGHMSIRGKMRIEFVSV